MKELPGISDKIDWRDPESLQPDPRNPKTHPAEQIAKIAASIRTVGFTQPILVRGSRIIAGHGRTLAAILIGMSPVPVIVLDHLDDDQAAFLLAADNRLGELDLAPIDETKLQGLLADINASALSLAATGYSEEDLEALTATLIPPEASKAPKAKPSKRDRTTTERRSPIHGLKTWPTYFEALLDGSKTFELRRNDRGFAVGDRLQLREWDPQLEDFTDREVWRRVTYVLDAKSPAAAEALDVEFVILGLAGAHGD